MTNGGFPQKMRIAKIGEKMKATKAMRTVLILAALSLIANSVDARAAGEALEGLSVSARADREDYVLGEVVRLTIRIANLSDQEIELPEMPSMENGAVRLFVADQSAFREYEWPGIYADREEDEARVSPGDVVEATATMMYVNRRETSHLSELYAQDIKERYLDTDYAFMKAGTYRVKAVVFVGESELESRPVTIRVSEPKGADLQVWNALHADPSLGYFIQLGAPRVNPRTANSSEAAKTLSDLTVAYPGSRLADDIHLSLAKYRETLQALSRSQRGQ